MLALLSRLLRDTPTPIAALDVAAWWRAFSSQPLDLPRPIDQAVLAGFRADRVGFAFAGGYEAALRALLAGGGDPGDATTSLPAGAIASFCATERGGNQPRAIETRLAPSPDGGFTVTGAKRWSTMGPLATVLLVVASEGTDARGRNRLRVVRVDATAPGVKVATMPPTPFVPEVPHATVQLDQVAIDAGALLPGDGYDRYVKRFRTIEDIHVHGALLGYLLSVCRRHGFPHDASERIVLSIAATRALADVDPSAAEGHIALAGLLAQDARLLDDVAGAWAGVDDAEHERWQRDRALFGSVAGQIRERRRERAWETITASWETGVRR
jgi:hypothetical protein